MYMYIVCACGVKRAEAKIVLRDIKCGFDKKFSLVKRPLYSVHLYTMYMYIHVQCTCAFLFTVWMMS